MTQMSTNAMIGRPGITASRIPIAITARRVFRLVLMYFCLPAPAKECSARVCCKAKSLRDLR